MSAESDCSKSAREESEKKSPGRRPDTFKTILGAGVDSSHGDLHKRSEKRHFPAAQAESEEKSPTRSEEMPYKEHELSRDTSKIAAGVDSEHADLNKYSEKRHFQGSQAESEEMSPDYSPKMQGNEHELSPDTYEFRAGAGVDSEHGDLNKRSERRHFQGSQAETEEKSPVRSREMQNKKHELSPDTSKFPAGAGVDSEHGDLNKRSEKRHFQEAEEEFEEKSPTRLLEIQGKGHEVIGDASEFPAGAGVDSEHGDLNKLSEKRHFQEAQAESEEISPDPSPEMQSKEDESSPGTSETPTGAGVDSEQGDLNKRSERRHFAGRNTSSIFSMKQPNEIPASN